MRVAVILTARPSWAKLSPVVGALVNRGVEVQMIVCASALLERYGKVSDVVRREYPHVGITEVYSTYEGSTLETSAKETGALCSELASLLPRLRADAAVVCADRHEVLGAAQAVSYLNVPLVHLQGGERSGSIDDKVRDSITALADIHCVATKRAAMRVYGLTGRHEGIVVTGCPSLDIAKQALSDPFVTREELDHRGTGEYVDPLFPFVMVMQHPVTGEVEKAGMQMKATLRAVECYPSIIFWPGQDAGQEQSSQAIRTAPGRSQWRFIKSLAPERFLRLLSQADVLIGNSSAGIREASFLGTPVVNVGSRQFGRERGSNVIDVGHDTAAIEKAIETQLSFGRYPSSSLYGKGDAGERIAKTIIEKIQ